MGKLQYQHKRFHFKIILIFLIFGFSNAIKAEEQVTFNQIDSISYHFYMTGNWDALIETGELSLANDIDFKWLQQRLGYAWFMKKQYFRSMKHYEQSLQFDQSDETSHLYLYYIGLNTGNISYARAHAGKLSEETQKQIGYKSTKIVNAIDFEYNLKISQETELRDNAHYMRIGINALPANNMNLYLSTARYNQLFDYTKESNQQEIYGSLQYTFTPGTSITFAYQHAKSQVFADPDTSRINGNLFFGKIKQQLNRFDASLTYANFNNQWTKSSQSGFHLGTAFSGRKHIYLKSSLFLINESGFNFNNVEYNYNRLIFKQTAGFNPFKNIWTDAFLIIGDQYCFADLDGLYIYNNQDPTKFKAGFTTSVSIGKHLSVSMSYNFDKKFIYQYEQNYYQHGITGGIIWKI
jgi:hypothetical protein